MLEHASRVLLCTRAVHARMDQVRLLCRLPSSRPFPWVMMLLVSRPRSPASTACSSRHCRHLCAEYRRHADMPSSSLVPSSFAPCRVSLHRASLPTCPHPGLTLCRFRPASPCFGSTRYRPTSATAVSRSRSRPRRPRRIPAAPRCLHAGSQKLPVALLTCFRQYLGYSAAYRPRVLVHVLFPLQREERK